MEEVLARAVQIFLALAGGYLIVLWFALVVWTYRDIGSRSQSVVTQIFATLLSLLFFIPGALLYLLMRPRTTIDEAFQRSLEEEYLLQDIEEAALCPSCQRHVSDDFILCPHCQASLKQPCTSCGQLIKPAWPLCPYCGSDQSERAISIQERVEPPAERYLERDSRTFRQVTAVNVREVQAPVDPALDLGYQAELAAVAGSPEPATEAPVEEIEPIKLFDRKRTRARKQKNGASPEAEITGSVSNGVQADLGETVAEDNAVIAQFVANGSNGNGAHPDPTEPVMVEPSENEDEEARDAIGNSTSTR